MSESAKQPEHDVALTADERWNLAQRIASSREFQKASQLREILLYITRRAVIDNPAGISEQEIGCNVLGRRADFNHADDNIVRVQIRHLRRKLEEYFRSEGSAETIILTIPKGGYLPRFGPRPSPAELLDGNVHAAYRGGGISAGRSNGPRISIRLWLLVAGIVLTSAVLWSQKEALRRPFKSAALASSRYDPLWSKIFTHGRETSIVISDSSLVMVQDITDTDVPLSQYLSGAYPQKLIGALGNRDLQAALRLISARQYTSLGDATIASKLMDVSRRYSAETNIRYARYLSVRDLKDGNFILLGSRRGIPAVQLFEPELNFYLEEDRGTHKYQFRNRLPTTGEPAVYTTSSEQTTSSKTYADIALVPNLGHTGYVLLLSGIDMVATEAAGDLVTSPDFPTTLSRLLSLGHGQRPASFVEILLQVNAIGGTAEGSKIVSYRLLNPPKNAS